MDNSSGFASVKLPAALVQQAREAAGPLRRSVAGQIESWANLGRVVEHTGLTAQEALTAIEGYEAAARMAHLNETLDGIEARFAAAESSGVWRHGCAMSCWTTAQKSSLRKWLAERGPAGFLLAGRPQRCGQVQPLPGRRG